MNWRARISPKRLIIAAASARPFVRAAAAAGYPVIAADVFCDEDTRRDAFQALSLRYEHCGFDAADLRTNLLPLLCEQDALVYGSGFETRPALLEEIAGHCAVLGNEAATVAAVKDPHRFFGFLQSSGIPCPDVAFDGAGEGTGWLSKRVGGSGGTHVQSMQAVDPDRYHQRLVPGRPCSLLFLADGAEVLPIGWHEQWLAPTDAMPYRYGGAVSQAAWPSSVRTQMLEAAFQLTRHYGLRGLNSLDGMVDGERWWALEINPRLSATFALHDVARSGAGLFEAHLQACRGRLDFALPDDPACAHLIYYAPRDCRISPAMVWPEWVCDVPPAGTDIPAGEPLCSIMAAAPDADAAAGAARLRAAGLTELLNQLPEQFS